MVGVPAAADIRQLRLCLADFGNFREFAILRKIVVHDDWSDLAREIDVPLFINLLVAKHYKTACRKLCLDCRDVAVGQIVQIESQHLGADML